MNKYLLFTDSGCDIAPDLLAEWGVKLIPLSFHLAGTQPETESPALSMEAFYQEMRSGSVFQTAAANSETFRSAFSPYLAEGYDVLYLCFSSGLSSTVNAANLAAKELTEEYPEQNIIVLDTLAASAGQGLLVYFAAQKAKAGASLQEVADDVLALRPRLCHWFTVDDLVYLKRGGRVSSTAAFVGGVLDIKPVLHVDDEGHLINMLKVRGRKKSISALLQKYEETAEDKENGVYFISHGDCLADAQALEAAIRTKYGNSAQLITYIGPVIGSHSGPGTLALFFLGNHR